MSSAPPLRIALVGVGRMGSFHARQLATAGYAVSIVAVADASPAALDAVVAVVGDVARYDSAGAAFAHDGVEACLIATSTPTHPAIVRTALDAGLHVLCEKPLSLDPVESIALGTAAHNAGKVLQVGFWRRFSPPWRRTKEAIDAGRIGAPLYLRLCQWDADPPPASFCDPAVSGGLAVDCGVHECDLAEWLTGRRVERVRAWSLPPVDGGLAAVGDIDNLVAVLELEGGAVATVDLSRNCRYGDDVRTEILGSLGAALIDMLPVASARLGTATGMVALDGSSADDAQAAGVVEQAAAFARAVRSGDTGELPGALASARATHIGHAIGRAAETGATIEIEPLPLE